MRRSALIVGVVLAAGLAMAVGEDLHRPGSVGDLLMQLNGTPMAWRMQDGGASGFYGTGLKCTTVDKGAVLQLDITTGIFICMGQTDYWDAGCVIDPAVTELNNGFRGWENTTKYLVIPETADLSGKVAVYGGDAGQQRLLCTISDDGGAQVTKMFRLR